MSPHNGSNGGSRSFDDITEEVLADSREAERLAEAARAAPDDASTIAKAERALDKFFETDSESRREKIVERALEIDPGCVAALTLASQTLDDPTDAATVLEAAVEVGERRLGPELFERGKGKFWDINETRPYMRALFALAEAQMDEMDYGSGLASYRRLLDLASNDALGIRFTLTGALLAADRVEEAREIAFDRYGADASAPLLWARTLILFLERDFDAANAALERARAANEHVESFLDGELELSEERQEADSPGSFAEAEIIARDQLIAWRARPLALVWLKVGGKPGDDRYFGAFTDADLQDILDNDDDDDEFFDDLDDDLDDDEPYLLN